MANTPNLARSTFRADSAVEDCTCFPDCASTPDTSCATAGWHSHADEPCALHPPREVP